MNLYHLLAVLVMTTHFTWILFNIFGFLLVWKFPKIKYVHISTLSVTLGLMILRQICPLTAIEQELRMKAYQSPRYQEGFLVYYLEKFIYYDVPKGTIFVLTAILTLTALWLYFIHPYLKNRKKARI